MGTATSVRWRGSVCEANALASLSRPAATVATCPGGSRFLTALPLAYLIWRLGFASPPGARGPAPGSLDEGPPPSEPEDVEGLDVYLVCGECGTEYKVSRLGELRDPPPLRREDAGGSPCGGSLSRRGRTVFHIEREPVIHRVIHSA